MSSLAPNAPLRAVTASRRLRRRPIGDAGKSTFPEASPPPNLSSRRVVTPIRRFRALRYRSRNSTTNSKVLGRKCGTQFLTQFSCPLGIERYDNHRPNLLGCGVLDEVDRCGDLIANSIRVNSDSRGSDRSSSPRTSPNRLRKKTREFLERADAILR